MKNNIWSFLLISLIPIGELKALFYHVDKKVNWYLLRDPDDKGRYIDNVLEDYGNALTFIILFGYIIFGKRNTLNDNICKLYFVVSILDILHLGAYDMQSLLYLKLFFAFTIWAIWVKWYKIKYKINAYFSKLYKLVPRWNIRSMVFNCCNWINENWNKIRSKFYYFRKYK